MSDPTQPPPQSPTPEQVALATALGDALGRAVRPASVIAELSTVVAGVRRLYGAAACSCALVEPDGQTLRFAAADGAGADRIVGLTMPVSRGFAGWVALSGEAIAVGDVRNDARFARDVAEATDYVPDAILAAPVVDQQGETVGVIELLDPAVHGPDTGHDLSVLALVGTQLASVIRLAGGYDALGAGVTRLLADPDGQGAFDEAIATMSEDDGTVALRELGETFRRIAGGGPAAARVAQRILAEVADYTERRR